VWPLGGGNCSGMSQMWECSENGQCIPLFWRCDGAKDCSDGSDESGCPPDNNDDSSSSSSSEEETSSSSAPPTTACSSNHWQCKSGDCIALSSRCDKFPDCPGGEDESNCETDVKGQCSNNDYVLCPSSRVCINPHTDLCNGKVDCPGGEDERLCTSLPNSKSHYLLYYLSN